MRDSEFWPGELEYRLPAELIAQHPAEHRTDSRLLVLDRASGEIRHERFPAIAEHVRAGDLLVANDSRVFPARLTAQKQSGGRVELLILGVHENPAVAMTKSSKPLHAGQELKLSDGSTVRVEEPVEAGRCRVRFRAESPAEAVERLGSVPLPPYIERAHGEDPGDRERYQTVYADESGSVAAPTAGLHFDRRTLDQILEKKVQFDTITLHVGPGTFTPIRRSPAEHRMEAEWCRVRAPTVDRIARTRAAGGRVIAVGTTTVRALESAAAAAGVLAPFEGPADIFIRPGYAFRVAEALLTNFHLPHSTLLCLVMAMAGEDRIREAYRQAVERHYRFYSFGDAMLIL